MKVQRNKSAQALALLLLGMLGACSDTTEADWQRAVMRSTAPGYKGFLDKHPRGAHLNEAQAALEAASGNAAAVEFCDASKRLPPNQPVTVTGIVEYPSHLKIADGQEFSFELDSIGQKMATEMNGKTAQVKGTLTGRGYASSMQVSMSPSLTGTMTPTGPRIPEFKVESYKLFSWPARSF